MTALKTQPTQASVTAFIKAIENGQLREDCQRLLELMQTASARKPQMWGDSIIGFGRYHYKYASGREGDWFITGFAPRKQNLTLYIMPGFKPYQTQLKKLGKHKTTVSCLHIKRLSDIDLEVLREIVSDSVKRMHELYQCT